ncbi:MAG: hypothetical protein PHU12_02945 [Candidatus Aenigmarchaeota archaeon]|nr:hypothetical protein [Candidatus Aenigmarchaeota archaeon]
MRIAIDILWTLMIFVIILSAFLYIFAAPNCEKTADATAKALKDGINEVAEDSFPAHNDMSVPTNPTEYREVLIQMCQQNTQWSWALSFWGGMPEYQIYYEEFPEGVFNGGSWLWDEAYPWSGGGASSMVFWGALKTGSYAWKGVVNSLKKSNSLWLSAKFISWSNKYRQARILAFFEKNTDEMIAMLGKDGDYILYKPTKDGLEMIGALSRRDAQLATDALKSSYLVKTVDGEVAVIKQGGMAKYVLNDADVPVTISKPIKSFDDTGAEVIHYQDYEVWSKRDSSGNILELTTTAEIADPAAEGFTQETFKPSDSFKEYISQLKAAGKKDEAQALLNMYAFPDSTDLGLIKKLSFYGISDTGFYQELYSPVKGKIMTTINRLKFAGYDVEQTFMDPHSLTAMAKGVTKAVDDDAVFNKLIKPSLSDRIMVKLGITNQDDLTKSMIRTYVTDLQKNLAGGSFLHETSIYNIDRIVMNNLETNPNMPYDELMQAVKSSNAYNKITSSGKVLTDADIDKVIEKGYDTAATHFSSGGVTPSTMIDFETDMNAEFFKRIASETDSADDAVAQRAIDEFGIMSGFLEKNTESIPASLTTKFGRKEIKRMVYIDGTAMINPNSWVYKQAIGEIMTEYCEGNSMCLYSLATQVENPYYMSEKADQYFIRVWRKVPATMYTSIQGNLMHPTDNPRFYLVSPCFGVAKIWKNTNTNTIYITVDKCDTGTSNYCYADEDLLNQYAAVWAALDWAQMAASFGTTKLAGEGVKKIATYVSDKDPFTVIQSVAESAISWPGYPWEDMTYELMSNGAKACFSKGFVESLSDSTDDATT